MGRVKSAFQYEGQWLIPEKTKPPSPLATTENPPSPLRKKGMHQKQRNNHFGVYEYLQVNLAYSSSRMASNRLTRMQVLEMYRTNRITPSFEPTKVDDIFEIANHFVCMRYVLDSIDVPLSVDYVRHIHYLLTHGTYSDKRNKVSVGAFRDKPSKRDNRPVNSPNVATEAQKRFQNQQETLHLMQYHRPPTTCHPTEVKKTRLPRSEQGEILL